MTTEKLPTTFTSLKSTGIQKILDAYKLQIAQAIPKNITPERLIMVATTVVNRNPDLQKCTVPTVVGAIMQSAILGLDPTPALGHCAFIPYKNNKTGLHECQFMIEYGGYITLARRSGEVLSVNAQVVYEKDEFRWEYGLDPVLIHKPAKENRGELKYAYCIWKMANGEQYFEVMNKEDVMKAKNVSQSARSDYSPWKHFESEMWRKTAVRRSRKYVPLSVEVQSSMASDEQVITPDMIKDGELDIVMLDTEMGTPEGEPQETKETGRAPQKRAISGQTVADTGGQGEPESEAKKPTTPPSVQPEPGTIAMRQLTQKVLYSKGYTGIRTQAKRISEVLNQLCPAKSPGFDTFLNAMSPHEHQRVQMVVQSQSFKCGEAETTEPPPEDDDAAFEAIPSASEEATEPTAFRKVPGQTELEPVPEDVEPPTIWQLIDFMAAYVDHPSVVICEVLGVHEVSMEAIPDTGVAKEVLDAYIAEKGLKSRRIQSSKML
jgi:recombination protein RecT